MTDRQITLRIQPDTKGNALSTLRDDLLAIDAGAKTVGRSITDAVGGSAVKDAAGNFSALGFAAQAAGESSRRAASGAALLADQIARENDILERIRGPYREHKADIEQLIGLYSRGEISAREYTGEIERMNRAMGQTPKGGAGGADHGVGNGIVEGAGLGVLTGGVAGIAAAATEKVIELGKDLGELGDEYLRLGNRINTVSLGEADHQRLMDKTHDLADRARSDWGATGELFVRLSSATKDLGLTQERTLRLTESITKAFQMSGASAQESKAGMLELSHAFAEGQLMGRQFNSISMEVPIVLDLIAKQMGVTRGELRHLTTEGKITGDVLVAAFENASGTIDSGFSKSLPTLSQGFTVFKNDMMQTFGPLLTDLLPKLGAMLVGIGHTISDIVDKVKSVTDGLGKVDDATGGRLGSAAGKAWDVSSTAFSPTKQLGRIADYSDDSAAEMRGAQASEAFAAGLTRAYGTEADAIVAMTQALNQQHEALLVVNAAGGTFAQQLDHLLDTTRSLPDDVKHANDVWDMSNAIISKGVDVVGKLDGVLGDLMAKGIGTLFNLDVTKNVLPPLDQWLAKLGDIKNAHESLATAVTGTTDTVGNDIMALSARAAVVLAKMKADYDKSWDGYEVDPVKNSRGPAHKKPEDVWANADLRTGLGNVADTVDMFSQKRGLNMGQLAGTSKLSLDQLLNQNQLNPISKLSDALPTLDQVNTVIYQIAEHIKSIPEKTGFFVDIGHTLDQLTDFRTNFAGAAGAADSIWGEVAAKLKQIAGIDPWDPDKMARLIEANKITKEWNHELEQHRQGIVAVNEAYQEFAARTHPTLARINSAWDELNHGAIENLKTGIFSLGDQLADAFNKGELSGKKMVQALLAEFVKMSFHSLIQFGGHAAGIPGFASGGIIPPGGSGGTDSQLIALRKSPNETLRVHTPEQEEAFRQATAGGGGQGGPSHVTVVMQPGQTEAVTRDYIIRVVNEHMPWLRGQVTGR